MVKKIALVSCLAVGLSLAANAQQNVNVLELSKDQLEELLANKIRTVKTLSFHPKLQAAVKQQNGEALALDTIQQRDAEWTQAQGNVALARALQNSEAGRALVRLVETNDDIIEAFLTDNQGANVAVFPATSDYWQGDEEKWAASFNDGDGQVFIGEIEFDDSTQNTAVQISAPVVDANTKQTIGVLVVGVKLDYLEARM